MAGVCIEGPSRGGLVFWKFYARGLGTIRFDFAGSGSVSNVRSRPIADVRTRPASGQKRSLIGDVNGRVNTAEIDSKPSSGMCDLS